jgi:hypothetical protein
MYGKAGRKNEMEEEGCEGGIKPEGRGVDSR